MEILTYLSTFLHVIPDTETRKVLLLMKSAMILSNYETKKKVDASRCKKVDGLYIHMYLRKYGILMTFISMELFLSQEIVNFS